jgi:hypothetical protein
LLDMAPVPGGASASAGPTAARRVLTCRDVGAGVPTGAAVSFLPVLAVLVALLGGVRLAAEVCLALGSDAAFSAVVASLAPPALLAVATFARLALLAVALLVRGVVLAPGALAWLASVVLLVAVVFAVFVAAAARAPFAGAAAFVAGASVAAASVAAAVVVAAFVAAAVVVAAFVTGVLFAAFFSGVFVAGALLSAAFVAGALLSAALVAVVLVAAAFIGGAFVAATFAGAAFADAAFAALEVAAGAGVAAMSCSDVSTAFRGGLAMAGAETVEFAPFLALLVGGVVADFPATALSPLRPVVSFFVAVCAGIALFGAFRTALTCSAMAFSPIDKRARGGAPRTPKTARIRNLRSSDKHATPLCQRLPKILERPAHHGSPQDPINHEAGKPSWATNRRTL